MVSSPLSPSFSNYEFYTMRVYKKKILPSLPRGKSSERFNYSYEWFAFLFFSSLLLFSVTYTHVIFPVNFASFSIRQIPASLPPPNIEVLIRNVALIHLAIIRSRGFFSYPRKTIQSITTRFASCHADFNPTSRIQREARQNAPYNTPTIFTTMIRNSKRSWFFPSPFPSHATRVILNKNKRRRRRRRKRLFVLDFSPGPASPLPPHVFPRFSNVNWEILPPSSTSN